MSRSEPAAEFVTHVEDSRRWQHVDFRPDDIVISTPPKCGTTWTQTIVASLLAPHGDLPPERPWPDFRLSPIDGMLEALGAQTGRRFLKSHCPADAVPYDDGVKYVFVYRDPADALVSWGNHRAKMKAEIMEGLNDSAASDGLEPLPLQFDGDYDTLLPEWERSWTPALHLSRSIHLWDAPNALFLHYADLFDDLPGEMRRLAAFLDVPVDDETFDAQVRRCGLEEMRDAAAGSRLTESFEGGPAAFFYLGGSGRGRQLLSDDHLARVHGLTAALLDPGWVDWLEKGTPS